MPTVRIKFKQLPSSVLESVRQRRDMGVTYREMVKEFDIPMHELCSQVNLYEAAISHMAYIEQKDTEQKLTAAERALREQTFLQPDLTIGDIYTTGTALYCKQSMQLVEYSDIAGKYIRVMNLDAQIS